MARRPTCPGRPISYTITVTNAGPSTATGVTVSDPVPAAITGVTATCTATGTDSCGTNASAGNSVSFTGATLAPGAGHALTLTVSGTISPDASGPLVNAATVTAGAGSTDTIPGNNTATDTDNLGATQVDLAITKTDGQTTYVPGTPITYTIAVTNAGPSHAGSFNITDQVPAAITGVTAACAVTGTGGCGTNASSGNAVSFTNASLAPGAGNVLTITISGTVSSGASGTLANTATVAAAGATDTNPANDSATDTSSPGTSQANLGITKTGPASVLPGGSLTYTLTVSNAGPSDALDVTVSDPDTDRPDLRIQHGRLHHALPVHAGRGARGRHANHHRDLRRPARLHVAGAHRQHGDGVERGDGPGHGEQLGHGSRRRSSATRMSR